MEDIYCMRCRKKTGNVDVKEAVSKNGRNMIKCKCSVCKTNKSRFI